jgi:hypothetical protein
MQGKMGIETRIIIRDSKQYHIIKTLKIKFILPWVEKRKVKQRISYVLFNKNPEIMEIPFKKD